MAVRKSQHDPEVEAVDLIGGEFLTLLEIHRQLAGHNPPPLRGFDCPGFARCEIYPVDPGFDWVVRRIERGHQSRLPGFAPRLRLDVISYSLFFVDAYSPQTVYQISTPLARAKGICT